MAALAYGVGAIINMAWSRTPGAPWYDNWIVAWSGLVVIGAGVIYMLAAKPYDRGSAAAGDAVPQERAPDRRQQVG